MIATQTTNLESSVEVCLRALSTAEKFELLSGDPHWFTKPNYRAGVPALQTANGPMGVRPYLKSPLLERAVFDSAKTTAFPGGISLAAAWDPELSERVGAAIAGECNVLGVDVLLAPCVCMVRVPFGGRNFESHGEDPFLAGRLAARFIAGVEGEGVGSSLKHFVGNDTDWKRHNVDMRIGERALREIYLRPFQIAIEESAPETVMFAYPKINGDHCCEHPRLLGPILRGEWGYEGVTISDWMAVRSGLASFDAGVDLEMPRARYFEGGLLAAIESDAARLRALDDKVRRLIRLSLKRKAFLEETGGGRKIRPGTARQRRLARRAACESMVLLKNEGSILPLSPDAHPRIAVIGPNADVARPGAGGSSVICPERCRSPLEVLRERVGASAAIRHAPGIRRASDALPIPEANWYRDARQQRRGLQVEYFNNLERRGEPVLRKTVGQVSMDWGDFSPERGVYPSYFSARFEGWLAAETSGEWRLRLFAKDGARLWIDGELIVDLIEGTEPGVPETIRWSRLKSARPVVALRAAEPRHVVIEYANRAGKACLSLGWEPHDPDPLGTAVRTAMDSDIALVFAGSAMDEHEGGDLPDPRLPDGQDELIHKVAEANPRTVVVLNNGTPYFLDRWIDQVPAVLEAWFPGQEGAEAMADLLLGEASPCGKLPFTYFHHEGDNPAMAGYPAVRDAAETAPPEDVDQLIESTDERPPRIDYEEGLFLGYRHVDRAGLRPLFAFGHGLSYTSFQWSPVRAPRRTLRPGEALECSVVLENVGSMDGAEVVQLYAGPVAPAPDAPVRRLAAFGKVFVPQGKRRRAKLRMLARELETYDEARGRWHLPAGRYRIELGSASDRIVDSFEIEVAAE